ncbi:HK97 gp10 family phage protein [Sporosarcina saromensis]|uniref:HK97 gp10 family phage protein n=1 Tax=Sporosarcina saromensis TaxID=359365 RepID=A0ABU4G5C2_9BACL|nr:HK97-gp10 family putative phage morphogenesis protein [Sporosarcina saromensis]MDW0112158.1 HK97 gp10 family phage protein [Sporosarcina saromensis]
MSSFKIDGFEKFMSTIERMPAKLNDEAKKAIHTRTLEMEANAKSLSPIDTGHLRRSLNSTFSDEGSSTVGEVSTVVEYAPFVEFGTSKQAAQPFLTPSFVNASKNLEADLKKVMGGLDKL